MYIEDTAGKIYKVRKATVELSVDGKVVGNKAVIPSMGTSEVLAPELDVTFKFKNITEYNEFMCLLTSVEEKVLQDTLNIIKSRPSRKMSTTDELSFIIVNEFVNKLREQAYRDDFSIDGNVVLDWDSVIEVFNKFIKDLSTR